MPELLAPAGNFDCLRAAINAGCDAVYLAGINYGARSYAGNFSNEELIKAVNLCHLYRVKVYVTVNTLIYDSEVERFLKYVDFLVNINVDAFIMQDIGMVDLVRKIYPDFEIHASTQMNIHNLDGVKFCEELGLKRVVLARETPIELIKKIKENTNVELEIFAHGALCMSYSGECLMSSLIGGRSGNRGTCAQSCRQKYSLEVDGNVVSNNKYLLSTKDLNTLKNIGELIDIGVDSLKIEGRMKRPEYVFLVVKMYRKAIENYKKYGDSKITEEDIKELKKIFNRDFTKGFIFNEENDKYVNINRPNHMGIEIGKVIKYSKNIATIKLSDNLVLNDGIRIIGANDVGFVVTSMFKGNNRINNSCKGDIINLEIKEKVNIGDVVLKTTDYIQLKNLNNLINQSKKITLSGSIECFINKKIRLDLTDGIDNVCIYSDYIVEPAKTSCTNNEEIIKRFSKLGETCYKLENLNIKSDDNIFIPIFVLNLLKREAINILDNKKLKKINYKKKKYSIKLPDFENDQIKAILIDNYQKYLEIRDKYDIIYADNKKLFNNINDKKCRLKIFRINENLQDFKCKLLVSDLGSIYKYKNVDTDFSLNVVNSYSVAFLHSVGVEKITLSYEMTFNQVKRLIENYNERYKVKPNLEVIIEANEEVMICKYNMLRKYNTDIGYLVDRFSNKYKIKIKNNYMIIQNYKRRKLREDYYKIGVNSIRVNYD